MLIIIFPENINAVNELVQEERLAERDRDLALELAGLPVPQRPVQIIPVVPTSRAAPLTVAARPVHHAPARPTQPAATAWCPHAPYVKAQYMLEIAHRTLGFRKS